jgi:putative phosphoesterase
MAQKKLTIKSGSIGLISDTHGLMRPEALAALKGSEVIIHAGDIGKLAVIDGLATLAPVLAIRGNNDRNSWAKQLPDLLDLRINGVRICVVHNANEMDSASLAGFQAVVSGHSHKPGLVTKDGVLFINPGSAGPRRFKLPIALARIRLDRGKVRARIINLFD